MDQRRHIEAWIIAEDILNSIVNTVVSSKHALSSTDNSSSTSTDITLLAADEQKENVSEYENVEKDLGPLSDSMREEDKRMRLTILQKLLELACAMVFILHTCHLIIVVFLHTDKKWRQHCLLVCQHSS